MKMTVFRETPQRLRGWKFFRWMKSGRCKALFWWIALVLMNAAVWCYYKHPLFLFWRNLELPILLGAALAGAWSAWPVRGREKEAALRLALAALLAVLVLGQEGVFRWQQSQVLQGGAAFSRLGRHFVVGFLDFEDLKPLAGRGLIGGIYITRRNLEGETAASLRGRIDELQRLRARAGLPPLFVMADQEGGTVSHLSPLLERMPPLSGLLAEGAENLEPRARAYGERQGHLLAGVGINMNLAPVVDLKIESAEPWDDRLTRIGQRAIASDPQLVVRVAAAYAEGLALNGVQPTVKHFPGLGRVRADTHFTGAVLASDPLEQAADWLPFREVTARTGAAMMLSHVCLPAVDPDWPVSLSRTVVQDVLRGKDGSGWNYQGLLITDDLNMGAVYSGGIGRAAVAALDAGVDLILVSYDPDQYYRALHTARNAWERGTIDAAREAVSAERLSRYWKRETGASCRPPSIHAAKPPKSGACLLQSTPDLTGGDAAEAVTPLPYLIVPLQGEIPSRKMFWTKKTESRAEFSLTLPETVKYSPFFNVFQSIRDVHQIRQMDPPHGAGTRHD